MIRDRFLVGPSLCDSLRGQSHLYCLDIEPRQFSDAMLLIDIAISLLYIWPYFRDILQVSGSRYLDHISRVHDRKRHIPLDAFPRPSPAFHWGSRIYRMPTTNMSRKCLLFPKAPCKIVISIRLFLMYFCFPQQKGAFQLRNNIEYFDASSSSYTTT